MSAFFLYVYLYFFCVDVCMMSLALINFIKIRFVFLLFSRSLNNSYSFDSSTIYLTQLAEYQRGEAYLFHINSLLSYKIYSTVFFLRDWVTFNRQTEHRTSTLLLATMAIKIKPRTKNNNCGASARPNLARP